MCGVLEERRESANEVIVRLFVVFKGCGHVAACER